MCGECWRNFREQYPKQRHYHIWTGKERQFILDNWGMRPKEEIAWELGLKVLQVVEAARRFGAMIPLIKIGCRVRENVRRLRKKGKSYREIRNRVGISYPTIIKILRAV